jgi:N-acetylglucosamine transport system permease protein
MPLPGEERPCRSSGLSPKGCDFLNKRARNLFAAVTILPNIALVALFLIYPTLQMLYQSFFTVSALMGNSSFVGFENYTYLFQDQDFITALKNTLVMILVIPLLVPSLSVLLAVLVTQSKLKEKSLYRVLFFFPSVLPMVTVGILWQFIFHPTIGVINSALKAVGLASLANPWLGDERYAMLAVILVMVWQAAGYYMVMDIAGIDRIPKELYESADLDGANPIRKFTAITLPFLWEVVRMTVVFAISGAINMGFIITQIMTAGGPGLSTTVLLRYMYTQAFTNSNFGYAMSIAVVVLLMSFIISLVSNKVTEKETLEF